MKTDILLKNAVLLCCNEAIRAVPDGCVAVKDGVIRYAGSMTPDIQAQREIDCHGGLLTPGLVNGHTHLAMTLFRNMADDMPLQQWLEQRIWPLEDKLTDESVYYGTLLSVLELLRAGVTAVNDMYFFMDTVAKAVMESGIRALLCCGLMDAAPGGDQRIQNNIELHRQWHGGGDGRIRVAFGPHAEYTCSVGYLERVAQAASEHGARVHMHISETQKEHEACKQRHGKTPIALAEQAGLLNGNFMAAHGVYLEEADMRLMAQNGASLLHCPGSNLKLGSGIAPLVEALRHGVNVALGTDSAASNNNLDILEEMRLSATLHKGRLQDALAVPAGQALALGTRIGARALGFEKVGVIQEGYQADLVLWDTRGVHWQPVAPVVPNLVYAAQAGDVCMTMVQGVILYHDGVFPHLDAPRIIARANECARAMTGA